MPPIPFYDPETLQGRDGRTFQEVVDEYFTKCETAKRSPSVTGLALALGYADRRSLWKIEKDHPSSPIVDALKRARGRIEEHIIQLLHRGGNNTIGTICVAKNTLHWTDGKDDELKRALVLTLDDKTRAAIERLAEAMLNSR